MNEKLTDTLPLEAARIAELEKEATECEARTRKLEIRLAMKEEKLRELQAAENKRRERDAQQAVVRLVCAGKVADEMFERHEWEQKFIAEPSLIKLALAGLAKTRTRNHL